jgi:hypothetical protein
LLSQQERFEDVGQPVAQEQGLRGMPKLIREAEVETKLSIGGGQMKLVRSRECLLDDD